MTTTASNPLQAPPPPPSADHPEAVAVFARAGWTTKDWDDLYLFLPVRTDHSARVVAAWLRTPPAQFTNPISPTLVYDLYARHPKQTGQILRAIAAGASKRFAITFLHASANITAAPAGWRNARALGLSEAEATGWAATGGLHNRGNNDFAHPDTINAINAWIDRFGPTSYLWVLAGVTLEEATDLQDAGTAITDQQLRVMAALNGHTLPPGI